MFTELKTNKRKLILESAVDFCITEYLDGEITNENFEVLTEEIFYYVINNASYFVSRLEEINIEHAAIEISSDTATIKNYINENYNFSSKLS